MIAAKTNPSSTVQVSSDWTNTIGSDSNVNRASSNTVAIENNARCAVMNATIAPSCTDQCLKLGLPQTGKRRAPDITSGVSSAHAYVKISSAGTSSVSGIGVPTRRL